jgi:hypothetical protein
MKENVYDTIKNVLYSGSERIVRVCHVVKIPAQVKERHGRHPLMAMGI